MAMKNSAAVKIKGEQVSVAKDKLCDTFKCELCSHCTALVEWHSSMRPANKATLAESIRSWFGDVFANYLGDVQYVLDSVALLHKIQWAKGSTLEKILQDYATYVQNKLGRSVVILDGSSDFELQTCQKKRCNNWNWSPVYWCHDVTNKEELLSNDKKQATIHCGAVSGAWKRWLYCMSLYRWCRFNDCTDCIGICWIKEHRCICRRHWHSLSFNSLCKSIDLECMATKTGIYKKENSCWNIKEIATKPNFIITFSYLVVTPLHASMELENVEH